MRKPELLSPAGDWEKLRMAVLYGADAVYLAGTSFGMRSFAGNFSDEELPRAVRFAHDHGVKVHATVNTMPRWDEAEQLHAHLEKLDAAGVDALILADLGAFTLAGRYAPHCQRHISTQQSVANHVCAQAWYDLGASRVVLARELPREEIAHICRRSPVEIEVFVHGALCMCYSGQCYLSSVIGRRSGNRGQCAQPCRLPYGYGRFEPNRYPLSLKDNCLVEYLDDLRRLGVSSLKIEGRMKRPEYVAVVTKAYRTALDGKRVTEEDLRELEAVFSRQGFTQGYYEGKTGADMFGVRQEPEENRELFAAARATYESGENIRIPIRFYAMIRRDEPAQLAVEDDAGHVCKANGPIPEEAQVRALTEEELAERLGKTGGTPYVCTQVRARIDPGLMLPASAINAMRRDALAILTAQRGRAPKRQINAYNPPALYDGMSGELQLTISVRQVSQITTRMLALRPAVLYVPLEELVEHPELPGLIGVETQLAAILPRVVWSGENQRLAQQLRSVYAMGVRQLLVGNLGQVRIAKAAGFAVRGDFGLNIFNSRAMHYLRAQGIDSQLLSFEMTLPQIRDVSKAVPAEVLIYGRLPLMLTENCVIRNRTGTCSCDSAAPVKLTDRMGEEFPVLKDPGTCRSVIYNGKKLYLIDKKEAFRGMGLWALRLSFTTENPGEIDTILYQYHTGGVFDAGSYTRGLYSRGVE